MFHRPCQLKTELLSLHYYPNTISLPVHLQTFDYAEFVNQIESAMGEPIYPDEDCIFLRIVVTVENIGTETGGLPMGWNEVVYDGTYEFSEYWNTEVANDDRYDLSEINFIIGDPSLSISIITATKSLYQFHRTGIE